MKTSIIILGDLFPKTVQKCPCLPENDFCVANLECAITEKENSIKKDGPTLKISPDKIGVLKSLGVNLVGLANNHILDYGSDGLKDTIGILKNNGISYAGHSQESPFFIKEIKGKQVGFYFISEHQYNYFEKENVGVNLLKQDRCFADVKELKSHCNVVFVMFHGGKEYYEYPTPIQQVICRKFVDSGADAVFCQHSHCVGSEEKYNGATILYGQGNFIFPYRDNKHFKTGLIIQAFIEDNNSVSLKYIPTVHMQPNIVEIATENEANKIIHEFNCRTNKLSKDGAESIYNSYIEECGLDFLYRLFNKSKLYVRLDTSRYFKNRMLKRYIKRNQKYLLYLYNYFNCETHVEYIKCIIDKQIHRGDK